MDLSAVASPLPNSFRLLVHFVNPTFTTSLRFFQSACKNSTLPTNTSTGKTPTTHATRHSRNCDSGLIDRAKIAIAKPLLLRVWEKIWRTERNLVAHAVSLADDYESSPLLSCCFHRFAIVVAFDPIERQSSRFAVTAECATSENTRRQPRASETGILKRWPPYN